MQILSCTLVLSWWVWAAVAHNQDGEGAVEVGRSKNVLEEPIQFVTKTKDRCSMTLTGHGELTKLRISCVGQEASYWCEYQGKPESCRNYNANPRHFFTQIMWELRKLNNACQGPKFFKPTMCKKASDESQMILISGSSSTLLRKPPQTTTAKQEQVKPEAPTTAPHSDQAKTDQKPNRQKPRQKPAKPQPTRPSPARPAKAKTEAVKPVASKPGTKTTQQKKVLPPKAPTQTPTTTTPAPTRSAETLAQQYCWHGMQDFCAKVISWFTK